MTIKAVYDKLGGIEPAVSRAMVQETTARMRKPDKKMNKKTEALFQPRLESTRKKLARLEQQVAELKQKATASR